MKVRFSPIALRQIDQMKSYLEARSPMAADELTSDIQRTVERLVQFPQLGHRTQLGDVRVIQAGSHPYLIFHAIRRGELVILRVRHAARRPLTKQP